MCAMATSLSQRSGIGSTDSRSSDDRRGALGGRLKISRAVSVEILYRDFDQKIPPRVDCGTLFLGSHLGLILETYKEAVRLFSEIRDPAELLERFGAICCSHSHWDHCHLQTLLWVDKDTPILIPKVREPSALSPPMVDALARIGFTDVREVEPWVPVRVDDIEVVPIPFHGEQDEPDFEMDHYTYVLKTKGLSLYGGVDCYRSTSGDMRPVLERVARLYSPDVAFLPVSKWICHYRSGGVNGFCRYLDQEMLDQSFQ